MAAKGGKKCVTTPTPRPLTVEDVLSDFKPEEMIFDVKACKLLEESLADPETKVSTVISILQNLEPSVDLLSKDYWGLVKKILHMNWLDRGPELIQVYHAFVLNLLTVHINYFKPFLAVLIKRFREDYKVHEENSLEIRQKMTQDFQHLHVLLQSLCALIPMITVVLVPVLEEMFPYINKGVTVFENYTWNLLKITHYLPTLRKEILDVIVKNMLKLDVRISREALTNAHSEEEHVEAEDDEMFSMDVENDVKPDSEEVEPASAEGRLVELLPEAVSLDALMRIVLNYIKDTCFPKGTFDWAATKKLYRELLSSFDKYIFLTHLSNHTQFLLFYICSFHEALGDGFVDYLWKKVTDPMSQPIYRQIAACYIGSFIARSSYVTVSTAHTVIKLMMQWVHNYLDQTCDINTQAGVGHHAAFYSVCQSCFYIFCFRHTQFVQMKRGHKKAEALNFQRAVTSKLNPLKYCLPIIVKTFSSATRTHQLAFCDTIIDRNNRYTLPVSSSHSLEKSPQEQLHSFFPFDPYLLKKSGSFIGPLYKEYQGTLPDEDVLENEDEDDFLPDDDVHAKSSDPLSMYMDKHIDLLQYSVSPGFQHADTM